MILQSPCKNCPVHQLHVTLQKLIEGHNKYLLKEFKSNSICEKCELRLSFYVEARILCNSIPTYPGETETYHANDELLSEKDYIDKGRIGHDMWHRKKLPRIVD